MIWVVLFMAIAAKEAAPGGVYADGAGYAAGHLSMHACVIKDVNEFYGASFTWPDDALDPDTAEWIGKLYFIRWATAYDEHTPETLARIWNGGPRGPLKPATADYGKCVAALYRDMNKETE